MQENSSFISENPVQNTSPAAPQEKASAFLLSLGALALVAIISGVFFVLSMLTNNSVTENTLQIEQKKSQITELQRDKKNAVAALVADNPAYTSINLSTLISNFATIANHYQIQFQNFSIKNDEIQTNLIAINTDKDAVEKIIKLMRDFAKNAGQSSFALEPILSVTGDRMTRTTPIAFKIVPKTEQSAEAETVTTEATPTTENPSN